VNALNFSAFADPVHGIANWKAHAPQRPRGRANGRHRVPEIVKKEMETAGCERPGSGAAIGTFIWFFLSGCTPNFGDAFAKEADQFYLGPEVDLCAGVHFFYRAFDVAARDLAGRAQPEYECSPHDHSRLGLLLAGVVDIPWISRSFGVDGSLRRTTAPY
jgi:hypothetical protein